MKFLLMTLITYQPDLVTGEKKRPAATSQRALEEFAPAFQARLSAQRRVGMSVVFGALEDFVDSSLELFRSDVAPVLRERIPSRPRVSQATTKGVLAS